MLNLLTAINRSFQSAGAATRKAPAVVAVFVFMGLRAEHDPKNAKLEPEREVIGVLVKIRRLLMCSLMCS